MSKGLPNGYVLLFGIGLLLVTLLHYHPQPLINLEADSFHNSETSD